MGKDNEDTYVDILLSSFFFTTSNFRSSASPKGKKRTVGRYVPESMGINKWVSQSTKTERKDPEPIERCGRLME